MTDLTTTVDLELIKKMYHKYTNLINLNTIYHARTDLLFLFWCLWNIIFIELEITRLIKSCCNQSINENK